jgi:hypothetical protein
MFFGKLWAIVGNGLVTAFFYQNVQENGELEIQKCEESRTRWSYLFNYK